MIDSLIKRKVSDVVLRLGVFLCIIAGLGARQASWLMKVMFQITISKSSIDRWVDEPGLQGRRAFVEVQDEVADTLPSEKEMVKLLHRQKPITDGHFDELFPLGTQSCVVVLKDEGGRIVAMREVEKRDEPE